MHWAKILKIICAWAGGRVGVWKLFLRRAELLSQWCNGVTLTVTAVYLSLGLPCVHSEPPHVHQLLFQVVSITDNHIAQTESFFVNIGIYLIKKKETKQRWSLLFLVHQYKPEVKARKPCTWFCILSLCDY